MENENIEVIHSEEGGNGLPPQAPSETIKAEAPAEPEVKVESGQPDPEPVSELYELPDGRKVDAETLSKEWKDNFYPDYTRKSQELAQVKATITKPEPADPVADPEWAPESYEELLKVAEQRALSAFEAKEQAKVDQQRAIEDAVSGQLESVKKIDPNVNENALFLHATKYGFRDLTIAHQNMRDMSELAKNVQKTTANNIAKRTDPVSVTPGATGNKPDPSQFGNAIDYLRSIK